MTPSGMSYCVVCRAKLSPATVRVVGPFGSQDAAVDWAHAMRMGAGSEVWHYQPDVLQEPTRLSGRERERST